MGVVRQAMCAVVAGVTLFAVGALFHVAVPAIAPSIPTRFRNPELFRPWEGWTSTYMVLHPFGYGAVFAMIYLALLGRGGVAPGWRDGIRYGVGVFIIGSLPVYLLVFASFRVSTDVIASWIVQSAYQYSAAGLAVGLLARPVRSQVG